MEKKIIKMEDGRKMEFIGAVVDGVMLVSHVVDPSRSLMYEFHRADAPSKPNVGEFEMPVRKKARATAKAKHGIAKSLAFAKYTCSLEMQADDDGDNIIDVIDVTKNRNITGEFVAKHWEIAACKQTSQDIASS